MRQFLVFGAVPLLALSACQKPAVEGVAEARVQLPAVAGRPGAAYFTLNGGAADNRLLQVTSPQVVRIELHQSGMKGGMMTMEPLDGGVAVPAGGSVAFEPGGKHAMLFDITPAAKPGGKLSLTFTYANGRVVAVDADVKAAGDGGGHQH